MWSATQQPHVSPQFPGAALSCTGTRFKGNPQCTFPIISSRSGTLFAHDGSSLGASSVTPNCLDQASEGSVWNSRATVLQPSMQWPLERQAARVSPQDWQSLGEKRAQFGFPPSFQAPYLLTVVKDSREGFADSFKPVEREAAGAELDPYPLLERTQGEEGNMLLSTSPSFQSWTPSGATPHVATYRNRYHANPPPMRYEVECPRDGSSEATRHLAEARREDGSERSPGAGFFSCDASPWTIMKSKSHTPAGTRTNELRKASAGCLSSFRNWSGSTRRRAEKCSTISEENARETSRGFGFSQCWLCNTVTWSTENASDYTRTEGEASAVDIIVPPPSH